VAADEDALRQGATAIDNGRADLGERIARDVLARQPRHPRALHLLGIALLLQERTRDAVAPLEQALRDRFDPAVATHLGKALRHAGRSAEALTWLERAAVHVPPPCARLA
jgi:protein O-GlcNAc transferase